MFGPTRRRLRWVLCLAALAAVGAVSAWLMLIGISEPDSKGTDGPLDPVARLFNASLRSLRSQRQAMLDCLAAAPPIAGRPGRERVGFHSQMHWDAPEAEWAQIDLGEIKEIDAIAVIPAAPLTGDEREAYGFPSRFRIDLSDDSSFESFHTVFQTMSRYPDPGLSPLLVSAAGMRTRFVRLTAHRLARRDGPVFLALAELMVLRGNRNIALGAAVSASTSIENPPNWSRDYLVDGRSPLGAPVGPKASPTNGYHSGVAAVADSVKWVQIDLGQPYALDEVRLIPALPRDFPDRIGFGFPLRFRVEVANDRAFDHPVILLDHTAADYPDPGQNPVVVPARGESARYVRVTATRLWERTGDYVFALAELQAYSDSVNVARHAEVSALDSIERGLWSKTALVDGYGSQREMLEWTPWLAGLAERREATRSLERLEAERQRITGHVLVELATWVGSVIVAGGVVAGALVWRARRRRREELDSLRQRIARDLHDEIGSNLGSIGLISQLALAETGAARDELAQINQIARSTAESMREIVWLLNSESESAQELVERLRVTTSTLLAGTTHSFEVAPDCLPTRPTLEFKRQTLLVLKEALHNAVRHATAKRVSVRLFQRSGAFVLEVQDDGRGFDPEHAHTGTGLTSMQARASALHGRLEIVSAPGKGCTVRLVVPAR